MEVRSISCQQEQGEFVVTITTDTIEPLYFRYSQPIPHENIGELALLALLLPSMLFGTDLKIPVKNKICPFLLERLNYFQEIFCAWYPELSLINIISTKKKKESSHEIKGLSFFSGGMDSLYTFYKVRNDIDHILFCSGLDVQLFETERLKNSLEHCRNFANNNDITLVSVVTNYRDVITNYNGVIMHGAILIAIASALSPQSLFVPGSHTLTELFPWGSHPLTDPLLAIGNNKLVHHGACRRSKKLQFIAENQEALDLLRVCNSSDEYNCGKCEKCLRTMFALEVIGKKSCALPQMRKEQIESLHVYSESDVCFWEDNEQFAKEFNKPLLQKIAKKVVKTYQIKNTLKKLHSSILGKLVN